MTYAKNLVGLSIFGAISATSTVAMAAGVDAGTLIENTASATFTAGGTPGSVNSNTVEVQVDELLDVAVASQDSGPVAAAGSAVLTFTVTNTGNGPEAFDLTANPTVAGNDYDVTVNSIAVDTNGNGLYDPGIDTILPPGTPTPLINPDDDITVFVLVTNPGTAADGDNTQVNLLAEAVTGTGTPGTVFAGQGEGGSDAVAGTTGADDDALGALIASLIAVQLNKTATIADPFGGTSAVPGAVVTYILTASINGSGSISNFVITDAIPADTTYSAATLALGGSALTDADDTDAGKADASAIEVTIGDANAGETYVVTFDVTID